MQLQGDRDFVEKVLIHFSILAVEESIAFTVMRKPTGVGETSLCLLSTLVVLACLGVADVQVGDIDQRFFVTLIELQGAVVALDER